MSSTLRRLSASLPFTKNSNSEDSDRSASIFRRKSSSASSGSADNENFRSLGARDYKLAMDPEETKERQSSVTDAVADMAALECARQASEGEGQRDEDVVVVRKGSKGRIYGARDWRLIGKE